MSPVQNSAIIFKSIPSGYPVPGEHLIFKSELTVDVNTVPLEGGVLSKTVCLGLDPYLRGRMVYDYVVNKPMIGFGIGVVLRSETQSVPVGSHVCTADYPFEEYATFPKGFELQILPDVGLPWSYYLGVLGLSGKTAWTGWKARAHARKARGETVYVSAAAGTVGCMVCQIAKSEGLKVIASAGSDEKVRYLREELGVDYAFNYKKEDLDSTLKQHGPLDIYWDTVGGQALETTMGHMNMFGRVIVAGFISQYNSSEPYRNKNNHLILVKDLTLTGFNVFHLIDREGDYDFYSSVTKLVKEGRLSVKEQTSTSLSDIPQLFLDLQKGDNHGKPVINLVN